MVGDDELEWADRLEEEGVVELRESRRWAATGLLVGASGVVLGLLATGVLHWPPDGSDDGGRPLLVQVLGVLATLLFLLLALRPARVLVAPGVAFGVTAEGVRVGAAGPVVHWSEIHQVVYTRGGHTMTVSGVPMTMSGPTSTVLVVTATAHDRVMAHGTGRRLVRALRRRVSRGVFLLLPGGAYDAVSMAVWLRVELEARNPDVTDRDAEVEGWLADVPDPRENGAVFDWIRRAPVPPGHPLVRELLARLDPGRTSGTGPADDVNGPEAVAMDVDTDLDEDGSYRPPPIRWWSWTWFGVSLVALGVAMVAFRVDAGAAVWLPAAVVSAAGYWLYVVTG